MQKTDFPPNRRDCQRGFVLSPISLSAARRGIHQWSKWSIRGCKDWQREGEREGEASQSCMICLGVDYKVLAKMYASKGMDGWMDDNKGVNCITEIIHFLHECNNKQAGEDFHFWSLAIFTLFFPPLFFSPHFSFSLIHLQLQELREGHGTHRAMTYWLCCTDGKRYGRRMANDRPWLGTWGIQNAPNCELFHLKIFSFSLCFVYFMEYIHPKTKDSPLHQVYQCLIQPSHMVKYHKTTHMWCVFTWNMVPW